MNKFCYKAWFPYMCYQDAQRLSVPSDVSQAIPAFATKACELTTKSHMLNFCEACVAICCDCDLWESITQNTKRFSVLRKKEQSSKQKNITMTFGKSLFLTQFRMRHAIYIPPNSKDLAINLAMVAYGNRQSAITFA